MKKKGSEEKFRFVIEIKKLVLKKASALEKDTHVSVCIERGKHLIPSIERIPQVSPEGDYIVNFNERLTLDATLYKTNGLFQDKTGKYTISLLLTFCVSLLVDGKCFQTMRKLYFF